MLKGSPRLRRKSVSRHKNRVAAIVAAAVAVPAVAQVTLNGTSTTYSTNQSLGQLVANSYGNVITLSGANRTVTFAGLAPRGLGATLDVAGLINFDQGQ